MLKRKIYKQIEEFYKNSRNALMITGARQIGKTFTIREFGKTFESFIEINFVESPAAANIFANAQNCKDILLRLSAFSSGKLVKGSTLIFLDEVQKCPEAVTAIKFLVEEGSYRYILSGSLLGVELNDLRSQPVGYMGVKEMYPLDFEEFATNLGVGDNVIEVLRSCFENATPFDDYIHTKMMELFRLYLVVGGMPNVINKYIESNNMHQVMAVQTDILQLYKRDIAQYDPKQNLLIKDIFEQIPAELNAKNKRFILKKLNEKARYEKFANSFLWLSKAGTALPVYNVEEPKIPLILARSRNLFKLFQNDIGLLAAQYSDGLQLKIITGDDSINYGAIYENAVAQELVAHGLVPYYYNSKKMGEVDFVVESQGKVLPIEVKSGKDYEIHRALNNIMSCSEYDIPRGIVLSNSNLSVDGEVLYAPVYMTMFICRKNDAPTFYKIDLTGLR
ncbi:MAG: ATP-binding protein [Muribaculaceae bacterium]|nr:ATP-binding protein [Muribaculaceae bacterium]